MTWIDTAGNRPANTAGCRLQDESRERPSVYICQSISQARKEISALERFAEHYSCMDEALYEMRLILSTGRHDEEDPETVLFSMEGPNIAAFSEYLAAFENDEERAAAIKNVWQEVKPKREKDADVHAALDAAEYALEATNAVLSDAIPNDYESVAAKCVDSLVFGVGALEFQVSDMKDVLKTWDARKNEPNADRPSKTEDAK